MKKILITGANSYIGVSFENFIKEKFPNEYIVDTLDMLDDAWREKNFSGYNSVLHVAGIAHQKETKENAHLYYKVNKELAVEVAKKAKADGVLQFVFLSSMSVYGMDTGVITKATKPNPKSHYGKSKWQAEQEIALLSEGDFKVCVIRPPMVYGKDCKGNFQTVLKLVEKSPIFPKVKNSRSMIYISNLSSFIELCIGNELEGVYFPQNKEYVSTVSMAKGIAKAINKKVFFDYVTGCAVVLMRLAMPIAKKAFGTLVYKDMEDFDFSYVIVENDESFLLSTCERE